LNRVLKAGASDIAWGQVQHDELGGVTGDQHPVYLLASGARDLEGDWHAGPHEIQFEFDKDVGGAQGAITWHEETDGRVLAALYAQVEGNDFKRPYVDLYSGIYTGVPATSSIDAYVQLRAFAINRAGDAMTQAVFRVHNDPRVDGHYLMNYLYDPDVGMVWEVYVNRATLLSNLNIRTDWTEFQEGHTVHYEHFQVKEIAEPADVASGWMTLHGEAGGGLYHKDDEGRKTDIASMRNWIDDFLGDSIDPRWNIVIQEIGYATLQTDAPSRVKIGSGATAGGLCKFGEGPSDGHHHWNFAAEDLSIIVRAKMGSLVSGLLYDIGIFGPANTHRAYIRFQPAVHANWYLHSTNGAGTTSTLMSAADTNWHVFRFSFTSTYIKCQIDDGTIYSVTGNLATDDMRLQLMAYNDGAVDRTMEVDYIIFLPGQALF